MYGARSVEIEPGGDDDAYALVEGGADGEAELVGAPVERADRLGREGVVLEELQAARHALLDALRVGSAPLLRVLAARAFYFLSVSSLCRRILLNPIESHALIL